MKPWTLKEQYDAEQRQQRELLEAISRKEAAASDAVVKAKETRDNLMRRSVTEDVKEADKVKAFKAVSDAEMHLDIVRTEAQHARQHGAEQAGVTLQDLVLDWSRNYVPAVRAEELQPIVDRARAALEEYYNAVADFYDFKAEYHPLYSYANDIAGKAKIAGAMHVALEPADRRLLPILNDADLEELYRRKMPQGYTRKPIQKA